MADLTANQKKACLALAQGRKVQDVAKDIGVRRETISEWKRKLEFAALISELRRELWQGAVSRAIAMVDDCIDAAHAIATGKDTTAKASDKLAAARIILDCAGKIDAIDLADRVAALEAQAQAES